MKREQPEKKQLKQTKRANGSGKLKRKADNGLKF